MVTLLGADTHEVALRWLLNGQPQSRFAATVHRKSVDLETPAKYKELMR
jgi:hypothetical protein